MSINPVIVGAVAAGSLLVIDFYTYTQLQSELEECKARIDMLEKVTKNNSRVSTTVGELQDESNQLSERVEELEEREKTKPQKRRTNKTKGKTHNKKIEENKEQEVALDW